MASVARRHHTVPRFYLDGFARDGLIGTVQLPGEHRFPQSIANASARTDFYTIPELADGPDAFERSLGELEGAAAAVIRSVIGGAWPLDAESRATLALFLAVQFLRGPDQRRQMEQLMALTTQLEICFGGRDSVEAWVEREHGFVPSAEDADRVWQEATQPGGPPIQLSARGHVEQLLRMIPEIVPYFDGRPWLLVRFQNRSLLTCDTPVALIPDATASPHEGVGLATAWGLTFPLSRRVGLILASPEPMFERVHIGEVAAGRFDYEQPPSARYAAMLNAATIRNTREWLFHHPDDAGLVPSDLPPPKDREVRAAIPDFTERESGSLPDDEA